MRRLPARFLQTLFVVVTVAIFIPAPAAASSFRIVGGWEENIDIPCFPCRGGDGIPVGTQGYSALDWERTHSILLLSLFLNEGSLVRFTFLGTDSWSYNQFFVDLNDDRNPFNDPPVFDIPRPETELFPVRAPVTVWLPAGIMHFGFRTAVDLGDFPTRGFDADTFSIFLSCQPTFTDLNPKVCSQGYIGFADGVVFNSNDDHQDLGVQFEAVPEPASLVLTASGLLGLAAILRRRRRLE